MRDGWLIELTKNVAKKLNVQYAPFDLKTGCFLPVYGWESTEIEYPVYELIDVPIGLEDQILKDLNELKKKRPNYKLLSISVYLIIEKCRFNILVRFVNK